MGGTCRKLFTYFDSLSSMDNPNFSSDEVDLPAYNGRNIYPTVNDGARQGRIEDPDKKKKSNGPMKKAYKRTKSQLQENKLTQKCFPPQGEVATTMTLILTIIAIFVSARVVMGPIADIGGTIFALLMLILVALLGGKLVLLFSWILLKFCKVDIRLPPLLGMLIVGILLKNIPYNFGQFGRADCTLDHKNASFVDSINDLDTPEEHGSFKRSIPDDMDT